MNSDKPGFGSPPLSGKSQFPLAASPLPVPFVRSPRPVKNGKRGSAQNLSYITESTSNHTLKHRPLRSKFYPIPSEKTLSMRALSVLLSLVVLSMHSALSYSLNFGLSLPPNQQLSKHDERDFGKHVQDSKHSLRQWEPSLRWCE